MRTTELRNNWIAEALAKTGKSQAGLARALGLQPPQVNKIVKNRRRLTVAELPLAERYLGMRAPDRAATFDESAPAAPSDYIAVPLYDMRISEGDIDETIPLRHILFEKRWLSTLSEDPRTLAGFEYRDEQLIVDRARTDPRLEGSYVLRIDNVLTKRAIAVHPVRRTLTVQGDDARLPTFSDVVPEDLDVVGRIVWIGRLIP